MQYAKLRPMEGKWGGRERRITLAKEIIDAIRRAEEEAAALEQSAKDEAQEILCQAREEAAKNREEMTGAARQWAEKAAADAKDQAGQLTAQAQAAQAKELEDLKAAVEGKRAQAVKAVLSELL